MSVTVVAVSLALGITIGGLAGYLGGWIDTALTTFAMNTFLALPGILLAIAFAAFLGPGFSNLVLALAIGGWAGYARLVRAQVMAVRDREYVDAARALGATGLRIFFRHILPNILQPVLVQAAIGMAGVILAEATLSFLGLGIPAPAPSWGAMLNDARSHLFDSPHLVLFPAAAVAGAVLGFNFPGRRAARPARSAHAPGDGPMKIGVVSDTHGLLRPEVFRRCWPEWRASCISVTWATQRSSKLCAKSLRHRGARQRRPRRPVPRASPRPTFCSSKVVIFIYCTILTRCTLIRRRRSLPRCSTATRTRRAFRRHKGVLYFNPGSCGPRRFNLKVTIGYLHMAGARRNYRGSSLKSSMLRHSPCDGVGRS